MLLVFFGPLECFMHLLTLFSSKFLDVTNYAMDTETINLYVEFVDMPLEFPGSDHW